MQRCGHAAHIEQRGFQILEHAWQARSQALASVGQLDLARGAVEQLQAELRLQFGDAAAHGRLRQADLAARAAEVARGGYREEHLELAQSHIHALKS